MIKETVYKFFTGRRNQHSSVIKVKSISCGFKDVKIKEMTSEDMESLVEERLRKLYGWLNDALDNSGLPDGTIINRKNVKELDSAVAAMAIDARFWLNSAVRARSSGYYQNAFSDLLTAIPLLIKTEYAKNEAEIIAGKKVSEGGNKEKYKEKNRLIELVETIYRNNLEKGTTHASRVASRWLKDNYNIKRTDRCIRGWFKDK